MAGILCALTAFGAITAANKSVHFEEKERHQSAATFLFGIAIILLGVGLVPIL